MTTRRKFIRNAAVAAGGAALFGTDGLSLGRTDEPSAVRSAVAQASGSAGSRVVSVAASDMLAGVRYHPPAVARAFEAGMRELTGEKTAASAWASLVTSDDVVGIKINCLGAPKISSSVESINAVIAGLQSAGVKENNIIVWDRLDREFQRTGLTINKGPAGVRVHGTSTQGESILPWVEGYDREVYLSSDAGTLKKFRALGQSGFFSGASYREIFNSVTWLWMLSRLGDERAKAFEPELRRLYSAYDDRDGIKKIADQVLDKFDGVTIPDEEKSCFSAIVTKGITKLVNIAVLKHNEDSGITWAAKNIALGVTTNKVRFHIDYCAQAIPDILSMPCLKNKMILHVGEAAKISTVGVAGTRLAFDNRIFFSRDPVAMDRIGLDILEEKRREQGLDSIRALAAHVASCARQGLGTDDFARIDWRKMEV